MPDRKIKQITLQDLALRLGVSAMTVSRALAGKDHLLSAETARRCREVAQEMGYVPNLMARSLRGEQLNTIVMFAEDISSHHYLAVLVNDVAQSIERRKYGVISCQSLVSLHQAMSNFKLAGAVIIAPPESFYRDAVGGGMESFRDWGPAVLIHSAVEQNIINEVSPDIGAFTYHASCHLLELGHRHLGYVGGPRAEDEPRWFDLRRRGIEKAFGTYGVPMTQLRFQACPDSMMGPSAVQQLLSRSPQTTAVMCLNDEIALSVVAGAHDLGRSVPHDFSVIGCNDIKLAGYFHPPLTTLGIDIKAMVETALDMLFEEIRLGRPADDDKPMKIKIPAKLIVRNSTAPPAAKPNN
jgi:LacI family transcriptional regulator